MPGIVGGVPGVLGCGDIGVVSTGIVGCGAGVIELSGDVVVIPVLSVAFPVIVRVLLSDAVLVLGSVSSVCVLAQAAVRTSVEAMARP